MSQGHIPFKILTTKERLASNLERIINDRIRVKVFCPFITKHFNTFKNWQFCYFLSLLVITKPVYKSLQRISIKYASQIRQNLKFCRFLIIIMLLLLEFPNWLITTIGKQRSNFFRKYLKNWENLQLTDLKTIKTKKQKKSILSTCVQVHLM